MGERVTLGRSGRVALSETVRCRQFDDDLLLLDLRTGQYFSLNPVGAQMWQALTSGKSPTEVATGMAQDYDTEVEVLVRDCIALADDLLERGLLRQVTQ